MASLQQFIIDSSFVSLPSPGQRPIPGLSLPAITGASGSSVSPQFQRLQNLRVNHVDKPVIGNVIPSTTGVFVTWSFTDFWSSFNSQQTMPKYFLATDTPASLAYEVKIIEGTFSEASINIASVLANQASGNQTDYPRLPGTTIFEYFRNIIPTDEPIYLLNTKATARVDIPPSILEAGKEYTVLARHVFWASNAAAETSVYMSQYAISAFRVNAPPTILNLRVNGKKNPTLKRDDPIKFALTISDKDGPSTFYRIGISTESGTRVAANIWDSGLIRSDDTSSEAIEISLPYSGLPLAPSNTYYWRATASDGMSDSVTTDGTDTFRINSPPLVSLLKANGEDILFGDKPVVDPDNVLISWEMSDDDGDAQAGYSLILLDGTDEILNTGQVLSTASSVIIPSLPDGRDITVKLRLRDATEFGSEFSGKFRVNAKPVVASLEVNGESNPGDVSGTPTFSWSFQDADSDAQVSYRIQVATDEGFLLLAWDTGTIISTSVSVAYGSTPTPVVSPAALSHGILYYWRVLASDSLSSSDYSSGFFAINTAPGNPTLLSPIAGSYSGTLVVTWLPASPLDVDGDAITYRLEITSRRGVNQDWTFLAGPLSSALTTYGVDLSQIPAGDNYGVRIIASDNFAESDPALGGTSSRITISNHAPTSPTFLSPVEDQLVVGVLRAEWSEASPVDVDGDSVFYVLEISRNSSDASPTWETLGSFQEGVTKATIDATVYDDGDDFQLRIRATDSKGDSGAYSMSGKFSISNSVIINDFERLNGTLYVAARDGRIFRASDAIWEVEESWSESKGQVPFEIFSRGVPQARIANGRLVISPSPGSTYLLRHSDEPQE